MKTKLKVKNVVSFIGREGYGFNADLYVNNIKSAFVRDMADGGQTVFEWFDDTQKAFLNSFVDSLPPFRFYGKDMRETMETVVAGLVDDYLNKRGKK